MKPIPDGFLPVNDLLDMVTTFESRIGPFYHRLAATGHAFGIWLEQHHANVRGTGHGGFMAAWSDLVCGLTTYFHRGKTDAAFVTVSLSHHFVGSAPIGVWLQSAGRVRKAGRSTIFVDCEHFAGDELVGTAQAVMKTIGGRADALKPDF